MRFVHVLIGIAMYLVLGALGTTVINIALDGEAAWVAAVELARGERMLGLCGAIVVLLLVVLYMLTSVRRRGPTQFISFDGQGGAVSISINAVKDFVQKIAGEFAAIVSMHPVLHARGGSMDVELDVRVKAGTHIPELCQMLQGRVRESIRDHLGLSDVRSVKVNVREIVGSSAEVDDAE